MARRDVIEVTCDRCSKKDLQDKDQIHSEVEVKVTFHGVTVEYDDLCTRCRDAVKGYYSRIAKIDDDKKEETKKEDPPTPPTPPEVVPEQAPAPPKKRSFLGGG